mgnify:CR=1 FL=1
MPSQKIMCCEDFERTFKVRIANKCCANCKHGEREYEGFATCSHPKRNDGGEEESRYYSYNAHQWEACDLWEARRKNNECNK